jgi:hypothetical protein
MILANTFCYIFISYMSYIIINDLILEDIITIKYKPALKPKLEFNQFKSEYKIYGEYIYGKKFDENELIEKLCNNKFSSLITILETKEKIKKCTNNYANRLFDCIYKYCFQSEFTIGIRF